MYEYLKVLAASLFEVEYPQGPCSICVTVEYQSNFVRASCSIDDGTFPMLDACPLLADSMIKEI